MADYTLHLGDCLDVMRTMNANSVDTVVCDPPYGLSFMGKDWDHGVPGIPFWQAALRVAKPGAMLLAFGGSRTHHRLMCAIEDAGWEIRDVVMWLYGSGFPKSHDISKAIDKAAGAEREVVGTVRKLASAAKTHEGWERPWAYENGEPKRTMDITAPATSLARDWQGWGTALKPAYEPIVLAMKPLDGTFAQNAARHGVAGLNIEGARIGTEVRTSGSTSVPGGGIARPIEHIDRGDGKTPSGRDLANMLRYAEQSKARPDIVVTGRWPANLILDEEACTQLGEPSRFFYAAKASRSERERGLEGMEERGKANQYGNGLNSATKVRTDEQVENGVDRGSARNHHPTVKPLSLMRYLVRLTSTPTGGIVLDPFMGSGSTGIAALQEGRSFVGIELDGDYYAIAEKRIANVMVQPELEAVR